GDSEQQRENEHDRDDGKKNRYHRPEDIRPERPTERPVLEQNKDLVEVAGHGKTPNARYQIPANHRVPDPTSYTRLNEPFEVWCSKFCFWFFPIASKSASSRASANVGAELIRSGSRRGRRFGRRRRGG